MLTPIQAEQVKAQLAAIIDAVTEGAEPPADPLLDAVQGIAGQLEAIHQFLKEHVATDADPVPVRVIPD